MGANLLCRMFVILEVGLVRGSLFITCRPLLPGKSSCSAYFFRGRFLQAAGFLPGKDLFRVQQQNNAFLRFGHIGIIEW